MSEESIVQKAIKNIKSIAVIGSGPSGAGTLNALVKEGKFEKIQGFEKRSDFGGLWNYTIETDAKTTPAPNESTNLDIAPIFNDETGEYIWASPAYDSLDTNVPRDIMTYADAPFTADLPIFPHRSDVLEYMKSYSEKLRPYVRFNTKVVQINLMDNYKWEVISRPITKETDGGRIASKISKFEDTTERYDAVVIATGNYDIPYIPNRPGMAEWNEKFPGTIIHVKSYRNPKQLSDEPGKILVVGNSASAGDIAYQLATELNVKIYKSKRSENLMPAGESDLIIDVPDIERFDADSKSIYLKDGSKLDNVSKVIFATGYLKSFPFLDQLNKTEKPLLTDGKKVHGNYEHVILYNYPNLAIVGIPRFVLPTRTSETQGCWLSKIWSGKIQLPSLEEMKRWESKRIEIKGNGKQFHDLLYPEDVFYCNSLNNQILESIKDLPESEKGLLPKIWDKEQTSIRGSIKGIKEAYIRYKNKTGNLAKNYQELQDAKVIDSFMISDEELNAIGFDF